MKLYKLYLANSLLVFALLIPAAWILAGVIGIIVGTVGKFDPDGPPTWIFVLPLIGGVFLANMHLRIPFEIKVRDDGMIEFRSVFRRTIISPVEIESVRAKPYALGFIEVVHQNGRVHLLSQMDGFHDFITTLKSLNPAVKIKGC
jgi:hypothetical protein